MAGVNKVILIGNLGQDPEVRMTNSGTPVCELRIACTDSRRTQDGQWEEQTEWVTVVTFGRTAENAGKFLAKGRSVYVEGRLRTSSWDDKETGKKRYKTDVVAQAVQFLGGRGEGDSYSSKAPSGGYGGGQQGGGYGGGQQGGGYGGGQQGGGYGGGQQGGGYGGGQQGSGQQGGGYGGGQQGGGYGGGQQGGGYGGGQQGGGQQAGGYGGQGDGYGSGYASQAPQPSVAPAPAAPAPAAAPARSSQIKPLASILAAKAATIRSRSKPRDPAKIFDERRHQRAPN